MYRIILILLLFNSFQITAEETKNVRIATLANYPPFCMAEENYQVLQKIPISKDAKGFRGYCWDIVRESFHEMGYNIPLSVTPWVRAMLYLKKGRVDLLFPTGKNSERLKFLVYSKQSLNKANFLVYTLKEKKFRWGGLKSLKSLRLGMIKGYNFGDRISAFRFDTIYLNSIAHGFRMLDRNRIEGFLGYEYNWDYYLNKNDIKDKYRKLPVFGSSLEYMTALKTSSRGLELIKVFDQGILRIKKKGIERKIQIKWFGE